MSTGNFHAHLKRVHPTVLNDVTNYLNDKVDRDPGLIQPTISSSFNSVTEEQVRVAFRSFYLL